MRFEMPSYSESDVTVNCPCGDKHIVTIGKSEIPNAHFYPQDMPIEITLLYMCPKENKEMKLPWKTLHDNCSVVKVR